MRRCRRFFDRQLGDVALVAAHRDALEEGHELGQRVSPIDPFVVNQPLGGLAMLLVDLVGRQNLGSVHDRGRQAALDRLL